MALSVCVAHATVVLLSLSEFFGAGLVRHGHRAGVQLPGNHEITGWAVTIGLALLLGSVIWEAHRQRRDGWLYRVAVGLVCGGLSALTLDRVADGQTTTYLGAFTLADAGLALGLICWAADGMRVRPADARYKTRN